MGINKRGWLREGRRDWPGKAVLTLLGLLIGLGVGTSALPIQIGPRPPSGGGGTTIPASARVPFLTACPTGWTQDATLDGTMLLATTAAHGDVGLTGGANLITPTGANSTPTFTGNAVTSTAVSGGTPTGTVSQPTVTMNSYTPAGTNGTVSFTPSGTNGSVSFTPAGTVAAPTFTGSSSTVGAQTFTGSSSVTSAQVISWPAGVPTFTGSSATTSAQTISWPAGVPTAANESAHTHTYTQVPNHVHPDTAILNMQGGTTAATTGTHVLNSTATGGSVRAITAGDAIVVTAVNPTGGVATGTTAAGSAHTHTISWPAGVPTNATGTVTATGTVAWPAGVPTNATGTVTPLGTNGTSTVTPLGSNSAPAFTGSSGTVPAQTFTGSSGTVSAQAFSGTPATLTGTVSQPTFTGSALATHQHSTTATGSISTPSFTGDPFDNRSAYTKVIWCKVNGPEPAPVATSSWRGRSLLVSLVSSVLGLGIGLWLRRT